MHTEDQIESTMKKFDSWGFLKDLSENDIESIRQDLRSIASTAIHESQGEISNILNQFYKETYTGKKQP